MIRKSQETLLILQNMLMRIATSPRSGKNVRQGKARQGDRERQLSALNQR